MRILLLMAILAPCFAQTDAPQPYDVKGVKLGSALTDWEAGAGSKCQKLAVTKGDDVTFLCPGATFAGLPVTEMVSFYKGNLMSFYFQFPHDSYEQMRDAVKQKFGSPKESKQETYQNAYGATFTGESLIWTNEVSSVSVEEIAGDRDTSVVLFVNLALSKQKEKDDKAKVKVSDM
jgi:hypothetical protein